VLVVGCSLCCIALRAPVDQKGQIGFAHLVRETFLLINNVILVVAALMIFVGTAYPLRVLDAVSGTLGIGGPAILQCAVPAVMALVDGGDGHRRPLLSRWKDTPVKRAVGQASSGC